jgi:hypothetical protein
MSSNNPSEVTTLTVDPIGLAASRPLSPTVTHVTPPEAHSTAGFPTRHECQAEFAHGTFNSGDALRF